MSFDAVLIVIIVGGIGLTAAYVRAEYLGWRALRAAERRRETVLHDLHAARLSAYHDATLLPSLLRLQGFVKDDAANPDDDERAVARRTSGRDNPPHTDPFVERRKRERQRATP